MFEIGHAVNSSRNGVRTSFMTDLPLVIAGLLALVAASIHGIAGDRLVLRELFAGELPRTRFGGRSMTRSMVHVTWHITTFAFFAAGVGMLVSALVLEGGAAQGVAVFSAATFTGYAGVCAALAMAQQPFRALKQHPGPLILSAVAVLAWLGAI